MADFIRCCQLFIAGYIFLLACSLTGITNAAAWSRVLEDSIWVSLWWAMKCAGFRTRAGLAVTVERTGTITTIILALLTVILTYQMFRIDFLTYFWLPGLWCSAHSRLALRGIIVY